MFTIKQYNTIPSIEATLLDGAGIPVDLTGSTVTFSMRSLDNAALVINGDAVFVDATAGLVAYQWADGDTDFAGAYIGEFLVIRPGGGKESFPNGDYIEVHVVKAAANPS